MKYLKVLILMLSINLNQYITSHLLGLNVSVMMYYILCYPTSSNVITFCINSKSKKPSNYVTQAIKEFYDNNKQVISQSNIPSEKNILTVK